MGLRSSGSAAGVEGVERKNTPSHNERSNANGEHRLPGMTPPAIRTQDAVIELEFRYPLRPTGAPEVAVAASRVDDAERNATFLLDQKSVA